MGLEECKIEGLDESFYYVSEFLSRAEEASILQKIPSQRWTRLSHRRLQAIPSTLTPSNTLLAAPLPVYLAHPILPRFEELGVFEMSVHGRPNHVLINEYVKGQGIMPHEDGDAYDRVVATVSLGSTICLDISAKPGGRQARSEPLKRQNGDNHHDDCDEVDEPIARTASLPTRIYQEPRSLLVTTGSAYSEVLHGISEVEVDCGLGKDTVANWELLTEDTRRVIEQEAGAISRGTRISLTYRDVKKVSSAVGKIFGQRRGT